MSSWTGSELAQLPELPGASCDRSGTRQARGGWTGPSALTGSVTRSKWAALAVLSVAQLMVVLDTTIVNVALPSIQRALHFSSAADLQWVVNAYILTFAGGSCSWAGGWPTVTAGAGCSSRA